MPVLLTMIALGGMAGAYLRYRLSGWVYSRIGNDFPWGTLAVNLSGSFALGLLLPLLDAHDPLSAWRGFITVGLLGAFTTFSTFAYEALMLLQERQAWRAAAYVFASVFLGLLAIAAGLLIGHRLL